jgi:glycosyltransferase involved in cell wall biosynthesis
VPTEVVHRELRSGNHDVFINRSLSEGSPVSLMEAQCVGMPVVATAVGGSPEVAPPELNELVSAAAGTTTVAQAILRAYVRPDAEGAARRDHWARNYRADTVYPAWAQELRELCGSA